MTRSLCAVLALSFLTLSMPAETSAQAIFVGAAATVPTQDFKEFPDEIPVNGAKTGWMAMGGVLVPVGDAGLSVGAQGFYGSNKHDVYDGDKTNLFGGNALVGFSFGEPDAVAPFVYGGVGLLAHQYKSEQFPDEEDTWTGPAVSGGAGVSIPVGSIRGMVSASYVTGLGDSVGDTSLIGLSAAAQIPIG